MKIGLYLPYWPAYRFSQNREGLGRYWAALAKSLQLRKNRIVIACPPWSEKNIRSLLEEHRVRLDDIDFIIPMRLPAIWKIWEFITSFRLKEKKPKITIQAIHDFINIAIRMLVRVKNTLVFLLLILIAFVVLLCTLPISMVASALVLLVTSIARFVISFPEKYMTNNAAVPHFHLFYKPITKFIQLFFKTIYTTNTIEIIRLEMAKYLREDIASMCEPVDVWYCPMAFWPDFNEIEGVKVLCFPDVVTSVLPISFSTYGLTEMTDHVHNTVKGSKFFITYSEYQKNAILVNYLGKMPDNIIAIDLFANDTLVEIEPAFDMPFHTKSSLTKHYSRSIFPTLISHTHPAAQQYLGNSLKSFNFRSMQYIFFASQFRPSKNILNLVRAYRYLLIKKEVSFKLILTGEFSSSNELFEYIQHNHLQNDVLSFYRVSNQQLSALYMCAELVVNPTLFEGGFPMTFCEGMSVGTPSILSRIPQVTDMLSGYHLDDCVFDPFDYVDIANKIVFGIKNRDELIKRQRPLYDTLSKHSKDTAGAQYEMAFKHFIDMSKNGAN